MQIGAREYGQSPQEYDPQEYDSVDDRAIASAAREALRTAVPQAAECIEVRVHDGWITLSGEVRLWMHKYAAEAAICELPAISGITNSIELRNASPAGRLIQRQPARKRHTSRAHPAIRG